MMNRKCGTLIPILAAVAALSLTSRACAADVALVGRIGKSAILTIDGGPPRTVKIGSKTREGVEVLHVEGARVIISVRGERLALELGAQPIEIDRRERASVTLLEDGRGHFTGIALINSMRVPFIVDTGATLLSIGKSHAARIGLNHSRGTVVSTQTASGIVSARRVRVASVQIGNIRLQDVDTLVFDQDLPMALLGMSVLSQLEMVRKDGRMILR